MTSYTDHPAVCIPELPGCYKSNVGFIYVLCGPDGFTKAGASSNPRVRIGEQCGSDGLLRVWDDEATSFRYIRVERILLSDPCSEFRDHEKRVHRVLRGFRFGRTREHYILPPSVLAALEECVELGFTDLALTKLKAAANTELNSAWYRQADVTPSPLTIDSYERAKHEQEALGMEAA